MRYDLTSPDIQKAIRIPLQMFAPLVLKSHPNSKLRFQIPNTKYQIKKTSNSITNVCPSGIEKPSKFQIEIPNSKYQIPNQKNIQLHYKCLPLWYWKWVSLRTSNGCCNFSNVFDSLTCIMFIFILYLDHLGPFFWFILALYWIQIYPTFGSNLPFLWFIFSLSLVHFYPLVGSFLPNIWFNFTILWFKFTPNIPFLWFLISISLVHIYPFLGLYLPFPWFIFTLNLVQYYHIFGSNLPYIFGSNFPYIWFKITLYLVQFYPILCSNSLYILPCICSNFPYIWFKLAQYAAQ